MPRISASLRRRSDVRVPGYPGEEFDACFALDDAGAGLRQAVRIGVLKHRVVLVTKVIVSFQ